LHFLEVDMFKKLSHIICALIALPASAAAQFSMPINNPVLDTVEFGRQIDDIVKKDSSPQGQRQITPYQQSSTISPATLNYKISMQRRKANYESFIKKSYAQSPAAGQEVEGLLRKVDPIQKVSADLQRVFGMRVDNVADAYALWMTGAWLAVNNPDVDLTRTEFQAVRAQIANAFAVTSGMSEANDEIKQNMAESLILNILIIDSTIDGLKNDPAKRAQVQASVYANAKRDMGVDLKAISLTDNGFVPRKSGKRGDAGEALDGALPGDAGAGQLASASAAPAPASGMGGGDIALLIAAVSAGAGGIFMIGKGIAQSRG
jgi:hypothetical protein